MNIDRGHLQQAVAQGIVSRQQAEALWALWQRSATVPRFDVTHILYYLGGLLAIGALTLLMNLGWQRFGGWGIVGLSLGYALLGLRLLSFFEKRRLAVPVAIAGVFVVALTPLAVYGLQQALGFWPDAATYRPGRHGIEWHWLWLELATLLAATLMYCRRPYPLLQLPVALALWYLSIDSAAWLAQAWAGDTGQWRQYASVGFGLATVALAIRVDLRRRGGADAAFWLYVFGVLSFWGGLTALDSDSEIAKLVYCMINLLMIGVGALLVRRMFVVFGALGVALYLGHLAARVFPDSWLFPISLTLLGLGLVWAGVWWQKHEVAVTRRLRRWLPERWQRRLDADAELP